MKRLILLLFIISGMFVSCQKPADNTEEINDQFKQETVETGICFNFVYPIDIVFRDGHTVTINDNFQYRRVMASCGDQRCFDFVYPISVVFRGGNTVEVNNDQQLRRVYASCD